METLEYFDRRCESIQAAAICTEQISHGRPRSDALAESWRDALFRNPHRHDFYPRLCIAHADCAACIDGQSCTLLGTGCDHRVGREERFGAEKSSDKVGAPWGRLELYLGIHQLGSLVGVLSSGLILYDASPLWPCDVPFDVQIGERPGPYRWVARPTYCRVTFECPREPKWINSYIDSQYNYYYSLAHRNLIELSVIEE